MDDKEKLEAIEKIINEKAEEMDDLPWSKREETNKLLGGIKQSEYEKILKHTVTEFFDMFEDTGYELNKRCKKEIIIPKPSVTEMKSKENSIFQVIAESFEEKELEVPIFSEDDIMLVCQQANCDEEKAKDALAETKGDIAQAILRLTSG